jgi:hypothetical protein
MPMDRFDRSHHVYRDSREDGNAIAAAFLGLVAYAILAAGAFGLVAIFHHFTR